MKDMVYLIAAAGMGATFLAVIVPTLKILIGE